MTDTWRAKCHAATEVETNWNSLCFAIETDECSQCGRPGRVYGVGRDGEITSSRFLVERFVCINHIVGEITPA